MEINVTPKADKHGNYSVTGCIRKIKEIGPLEFDYKEIDGEEWSFEYCYVYTEDEGITHRIAERMIAYNACAWYLQDVDYHNHSVVLEWFTSSSDENIIFGFTELDHSRETSLYGGKFVSKFCQNAFSPFDADALMEQEPFSGILYHGRRYELPRGDMPGGHKGSWNEDDLSVGQIIKLYKQLCRGEAIDLNKISSYGHYRKCKHFMIPYNNIEMLKEALDLSELNISI